MDRKHPLLKWFSSVGVKLHPDLYLEQDPLTGLSFYTVQPLARDTTVIQVPKELCITSTSALERIQLILAQLEESVPRFQSASLPAPDWTLLYLVLSRLAEEYLASVSEDDEQLRSVFVHLPYVSHIPKSIETPLNFSPAELTLLANTPLSGSTEKRLRETIVDYERARSLISSHFTRGSEIHAFSSYLLGALQPITPFHLQTDHLMSQTYHKGLELWRWAESAFTSRSFPPRLIGLSDHRDCSSIETVTSAPILIPAYDTFNHARAHPVTWSYSPATSESGTGTTHMVCMTLNYVLRSTPCQVYNNYGGKSNEEFLSGYGFTLDTVTEDTLALKLGAERNGADYTEAKTHYWLVSSKSNDGSHSASVDQASGFTKAVCPCPSLLSELESRVLKGDKPPTSTEDQIYLYASILETLEALLLSKRKAFRSSQKQIESLRDTYTFTDQVERPEGWYRSPEAADGSNVSFRSSVWANVMQYRKGQVHLLNHAVDWTRTELGRVADAVDDLE